MIGSIPKMAVGYAHSKLILTGEHAVVYGKPAIAIPFPLQVRSAIEEKPGEIIISSVPYVGPIRKIPVKLRGIAACIEAALQHMNKPQSGFIIRLHSSIPLGRGLGSSAAIAMAIVKSLFSFYEQKATEEEIMTLVEMAETYAHGNPSGIDMAAISSDSPIFFKNKKEVTPLKLSSPFHIVVADTGRIGDTHTAVKRVRENFQSDPKKIQNALRRIEEITLEAKLAITEENPYLLGKLIDFNHSELIKLGVSDEGLNRLVAAAKRAGALGAKLTGGGIGGCVIALAPNQEQAKMIEKALLDAGANKTWYFSTDPELFSEN